jgi:hypothetical protein
VGRRVEMVDGFAKLVRKITQICILKGVKNGDYIYENVV